MPKFATTKPKFTLSSKPATTAKPSNTNISTAEKSKSTISKKPAPKSATTTSRTTTSSNTTTKKNTSTAKPQAKTSVNTDNNNGFKPTTDAIYGVKTARALLNFNIGDEKMPRSIIKSMGILKKAATLANEELGLLSKDKSVRITKAADEVIEGNLDKHFPLSVWQTGSGMHSNMNVNEVIAARAIELAGGKATSKTQIDPTTDINMSHSHNDAFSTAMNISAAMEMKSVLIPAVKKLQNSFINKAKEFESILKIGRTHTMDAFLMTFEQQFNGYAKLLSNDVERLEKVLTAFYQLPLGGMIVGTDIIETNQKFAPKIVKQIAKITKFPFVLTTNKLTAISSQDIMANAHSTIKVLATSLLKISNDIRLLASGPRCGFGELILPENDMIDPLFVGKNNPLHCEAVSMVCMQVFGNDTTITFAAASGQFELNAYKPVIIYNFLQSIKLLSDAMNSFEKYCVRGIKVNRKTVQNNLDNTLVIITKVVNNVGYDNAVKIMKLAHRDDLTLKEAIVKLNIMSGDEYDRIVKPEKLLAGKKN